MAIKAKVGGMSSQFRWGEASLAPSLPLSPRPDAHMLSVTSSISRVWQMPEHHLLLLFLPPPPTLMHSLRIRVDRTGQVAAGSRPRLLSHAFIKKGIPKVPEVIT